MRDVDNYLSKDLQEVIETAVVRAYKSLENNGNGQKEITFEAYGMKLRMKVHFGYSYVNKLTFCHVDIWRRGAMDNNNQTGSEYRYGLIESFNYRDYALHRHVLNIQSAVVTAIAEQMKQDVSHFAIDK